MKVLMKISVEVMVRVYVGFQTQKRGKLFGFLL